MRSKSSWSGAALFLFIGAAILLGLASLGMDSTHGVDLADLGLAWLALGAACYTSVG